MGIFSSMPQIVVWGGAGIRGHGQNGHRKTYFFPSMILSPSTAAFNSMSYPDLPSYLCYPMQYYGVNRLESEKTPYQNKK